MDWRILNGKGNIVNDKLNNREEWKHQSIGPHKIRLKNWISCAPFERLLNMTIDKASEGKAILTMPFLIEYAQGGGLMHGGALVSLADTAVVMAIKSVIEPESHFATIALETKFLYPVKQGIVTAKALVTSHDDRILKGKATIFNKKEKPVLEFSSTFRIAKDTKIRMG
jgi:uncharacterized protein (TIGR00369 family)